VKRPDLTLQREDVLGCLREIIDPCSAANGTNFNLVEMGVIKGIEIRGRVVSVDLRLTSPACFMLEFFITEIQRRVGSLSGVESVEVQADGGFDWDPSMMDQERRSRYLNALRRSLPVINTN